MDNNKPKVNENLFRSLYQKLLDEETKNVHNQLSDDKAMANKLSKICMDYAANDIKQNR